MFRNYITAAISLIFIFSLNAQDLKKSSDSIKEQTFSMKTNSLLVEEKKMVRKFCN